MATAAKTLKQVIKAVEAAEMVCSSIDLKIKRLYETQAIYTLFEFDQHKKHPYFELQTIAHHARNELYKYLKAVLEWDINGKTLKLQLDETKARYIVYGSKDDEKTIDALRQLRTKARSASQASIHLHAAFTSSVKVWSFSSSKMIKSKIREHIDAKKPRNQMEMPEINIEKICKVLPREVGELNKLMRDVVRGKESIRNAFQKKQLMLMLASKTDDSLAILLK
jgi:hypothetical protein